MSAEVRLYSIPLSIYDYLLSPFIFSLFFSLIFSFLVNFSLPIATHASVQKVATCSRSFQSIFLHLLGGTMATSQTCCHLPAEMLNLAANGADRARIHWLSLPGSFLYLSFSLTTHSYLPWSLCINLSSYLLVILTL
jgi:hypothetical protein